MNVVVFDSKPRTPSKIVCVGRNYVEHIAELNNEVPDSMILFNKPNSALSSTLRYVDEDCHFESEISFLVEAGRFVGVGFGLDLTKRALQAQLKAKGLPWERAKAFDGAAVFSDFAPFDGDVSSLRLELFVNEKLTQAASPALMIHKPDAILAEIKSFMTLHDNDIVMTGTPKGVAPYKRGDVFTGKIHTASRVLIEKTWVVE